jgi:hypothetical protein
MDRDALTELYLELLALEGDSFRRQNPGLFPRKTAAASQPLPPASFSPWARAVFTEPLAAARSAHDTVAQAPFTIEGKAAGAPDLRGWIQLFRNPEGQSPAFVLCLRFAAVENPGHGDEASPLAAFNQTFFEVRYCPVEGEQQRPRGEERVLRLHVAFDPREDLASALVPVDLSGPIADYRFEVRSVPQHGPPSRAASGELNAGRYLRPAV